MAVKCDYKICKNTLMISAPEGVDLLPGRMLRAMIANIETAYELYEYSQAANMKAAQAMEDVVGIAPMAPSLTSRKVVVYQRPHPSFYDPNFIELTTEEVDRFTSALPPGEEFIEADYTLSMPSDLYMAVVDDIRTFIDVVTHLKLPTFNAVREATARLGIASITIYDEADMMVEFNDENFPELLTQGLERWLNPPQHVESLD